MITIENEYIKASIAPLGAELKSVIDKKRGGLELLWQGDKNSWNASATNLFPFVGRLKNGTYYHEGREYSLKSHGFARENLFQITEKTEDSAIFKLSYSEETLKAYPFKFEFFVGFVLDKNKLITSYTVKNLDKSTMFFGLGGHPGFILPASETSDLAMTEGNYLVFEKEEAPLKYEFDKSEILITKLIPCGIIKQLELKKSLFEDDAILLSGLKSKFVDIIRADAIRIRFNYYNCPYLAIWTHPKRGGYICIEPWCSLPDYFNPPKELSQKIGICRLDPEKEFSYSYEIQMI